MKTVKLRFILVLLAGSLIFTVTSCQKEEQSNTIAVQKDNTTGQDLTMPETDIPGIQELSDATLTNEFNLAKPANDFEQLPEIEFADQTATFLGKDLHTKEFVRFINSLNLSREQMIKLKDILLRYWKCKLELHMMLKKSNQEILMKANNYRMELIRKYKAGSINEEQLKNALQALQERTKNAIKENPMRQKVIENLKKCHNALMENLKLLLTREQLAKWIAWHKNQQGGGTK